MTTPTRRGAPHAVMGSSLGVGLGLLLALLLSLSLGLGHTPAAAAPAVDTAADPALEARVQAVSAELRCLVCQNQNLADSHAELALDLKKQVREQLRAGRTPDQVLAFMTERYGDFVLYRPPFKATTWLLWLGPAVLALLGLLGLARALRQHENQSPPPALSAQDTERASALLQERPAEPPQAGSALAQPPASSPAGSDQVAG